MHIRCCSIFYFGVPVLNRVGADSEQLRSAGFAGMVRAIANTTPVLADVRCENLAAQLINRMRLAPPPIRSFNQLFTKELVCCLQVMCVSCADSFA